MLSSVRTVSIAVLALLALASVCLAAEPPSLVAAAGADTGLALPTTPKAERGDRPGFGGIGGQVGAGKIVSAEDYSKWAQLRMSFAANWRYTMTRSWRWQVSPGFTWAGYSKTSNPAPFIDINHPTDPYKDQYLTLVVPISTEIQWVKRNRTLVWHVGAGPGLYRVWVENYRKVVPDPVTYHLHRGLYWGVTAEVGAEHFLKSLNATSIEVTLDTHYIQAKRDDQFPSGFNSSVIPVGLRAGVNYYFDLHFKAKAQGPTLPELPK
jgi:hypothetical protein